MRDAYRPSGARRVWRCPRLMPMIPGHQGAARARCPHLTPTIPDPRGAASRILWPRPRPHPRRHQTLASRPKPHPKRHARSRAGLQSKARRAAVSNRHRTGGASAATRLPRLRPFGPQSVTSQEGRQALSDLTQSALSGQPDYQGSPYADMGPQGNEPGAEQYGTQAMDFAPQGEPGSRSFFNSPFWNADPAWAQNAPTFSEAMQPGGPLSAVGKAYDFFSNLPSTLSNALNPSVPTMLAGSIYNGPAGGSASRARPANRIPLIAALATFDTTDWARCSRAQHPHRLNLTGLRCSKPPRKLPIMLRCLRAPIPSQASIPAPSRYWAPSRNANYSR